MHTLLLNSTYEPLRVVTWEKAITLLFNSKIEVLEEYEEDPIQIIGDTLPRPAVARLCERAPWRIEYIRFSRHNVYLRDKYTCQYCAVNFSSRDLTFDHVLPRSRGGQTTWKNIVAACRPCNQTKGDLTPEEAGMPLLREPYVPRWLNQASKAKHQGRHHKKWAPYLF